MYCSEPNEELTYVATIHILCMVLKAGKTALLGLPDTCFVGLTAVSRI